MRSEITKLLNMTKFFKIIRSNENVAQYTLEEPSRILKQNIRISWLTSVLSKTQKHMTVYLGKDLAEDQIIQFPHGYIHVTPKLVKDIVMEHHLDGKMSQSTSVLTLHLVVPENDVMQYFIQWQRYRKYWWSSITTTPSLFSIDDIKYGDKSADVNIVAQFPWGPQIVETVTIDSTSHITSQSSKTSILLCSMCLDQALFVLLLDGLTNRTREKYLRLHRTMAPYKMCYALEEGSSKNTLKELATLLHHRLAAKNISTRLPDFHVPMETQIKDNLELGVPYTVILKDKTLKDGIFLLNNSSTTLNEMVHIADFQNYAALICSK